MSYYTESVLQCKVTPCKAYHHALHRLSSHQCWLLLVLFFFWVVMMMMIMVMRVNICGANYVPHIILFN